MRMIRRSALGGLIKRLTKDLEDSGVKAVLIYADDAPLDDGGYDDPHKRPERDPELLKDLDGWERLG